MDLAELKQALTRIQIQQVHLTGITNKVYESKGYIGHTVTGNELLALKNVEAPSAESLIKVVEKLIRDAKKPPVAKVAKAKAVK